MWWITTCQICNKTIKPNIDGCSDLKSISYLCEDCENTYGTNVQAVNNQLFLPGHSRRHYQSAESIALKELSELVTKYKEKQ